MTPSQLLIRPNRILLSILASISLAAIAVIVVACSSGMSTTTTSSGSGMAQVNVRVSDPATCQSPSGPFAHVYVTITDVKANVNSTAGDSDNGWVGLYGLSITRTSNLLLLN